jgi:hypothetical protein
MTDRCKYCAKELDDDEDLTLVLACSNEEACAFRVKFARAWACKLAPRRPVNGPAGWVQPVLDGFDLHELYTLVVDGSGADSVKHEGCCAGCSRLPPGWCVQCDKQREKKR